MPFAKFILPLMHFNDYPVKRRIRLTALLLVLSICAGGAHALGLGELKVHSRLGAAFQADVQLIESPGDTRLAGDCFRLGNPGESDAGIPLLVRGRIRVERQNSQSRLLITSDQTVNEPVLQVNLRVSCGSELMRSYTVLIDPASAPQVVEQAVVSAPANRSPAPEKPAPAVTLDKSYPTAWQTAQGESAQSITRALFPRQPSAQRRFLAALKAENPQLALGVDGDTPLDPGTALNIPDTRRHARVPAASSGDEEKPAAKEDAPKTLPNPVRRERSVASKPAGHTADRLLISGDTDDASTGAEAPLRLSGDLSTRFSGKVTENSRDLLRLEYKLLGALYMQAGQQLAMAEQVRNLEASFEEMRVATENSARQTEAAMAAAPRPAPPAAADASAPGTPQPPPAAVRQARVTEEESSSWWLEILLVLGLIGALSWAFSRRSRKFIPEPAPLADEEQVPAPAPVAEDQDPWTREAEPVAPPPPKASGIMPDIVLDDIPPAAPGTINFEKPDRPVRHLENDETGDYRTVTELADIMVCFGRIKGATQALEEFLARDPGAALAPWMKLLEIFRTNDMREEFEAYTLKLRAHFNVAPASWEQAGEYLGKPVATVDGSNISIEELLQKLPTIGTLPHIGENILKSWDSPDGLAYITHLLRDTRDGKRGGFPLTIARELQFLLELLENRSLNKT